MLLQPPDMLDRLLVGDYGDDAARQQAEFETEAGESLVPASKKPMTATSMSDLDDRFIRDVSLMSMLRRCVLWFDRGNSDWSPLDLFDAPAIAQGAVLARNPDDPALTHVIFDPADLARLPVSSGVAPAGKRRRLTRPRSAGVCGAQPCTVAAALPAASGQCCLVRSIPRSQGPGRGGPVPACRRPGALKSVIYFVLNTIIMHR